MTSEAISQIIEILTAHFPARYKNEEIGQLGQSIAKQFSNISGQSFVAILEQRCKATRNPVDLYEVARRAEFLDNHLVTQYEAKLRQYAEHIAKGRENFDTTPDIFELFGAVGVVKDFDEYTEDYRRQLNEAIRNLPSEYRKKNGIKEVI